MNTAQDIANYILVNSCPEEGDLISHLKLQKLLYYCQGFHLAIHNSPLFKETIEHWDHGPVVPDVYKDYKEYGSNALPVPHNFDYTLLSSQTKEIIDEVRIVYGQFSAWKLRDMTHQEPPWQNTNACEEITHQQLKNYFSTQLID